MVVCITRSATAARPGISKKFQKSELSKETKIIISPDDLIRSLKYYATEDWIRGHSLVIQKGYLLTTDQIVSYTVFV